MYPLSTPPLVTPQAQNPFNPLGNLVPSVTKPSIVNLPTTQAPNTTVTSPPIAPQQWQGAAKAYAAAQRKNDKVDAKRRQGTQARQTLEGYGPPPQEQAAQYTAPQFTPAQYQAPKNDAMRYLALGLSALFGGSRIGSMATGFLLGQNQKAQNTYTREEQQAEQQYQVAKDQAQAAFANQQERNQVAYQNAVAVWNNNKDIREQGINPLNGRPFQYPTIQQAGAKPGNFQSEFGAYDRLIQLAQRNGDTGAIQRYANAQQQLVTQYQDIQKMNLELARMQEEWNRFDATQRNENARFEQSQAAAESRFERSQAGINYRYEHPRTELTPIQRIQASEAAQRAATEFQSHWNLYTKGGIQNGAPVDPVIPGVTALHLRPMFAAIRLSQDPQGLAQYLKGVTKDPNVQSILSEYGNMIATQHYAQGQPVIPQQFPSQVTPKDLKELGIESNTGSTSKHSSQHLEATSNGQPIHSNDGGRTWLPGKGE